MEFDEQINETKKNIKELQLQLESLSFSETEIKQIKEQIQILKENIEALQIMKVRFSVTEKSVENEYEKAANFWIEKDKDNKKMSREALLGEVVYFLSSHKVCSLATGYEEFVRNTPIEYSFFDGAFWFFSEGGLKFKALEHNKNVSIAVYNPNYSQNDMSSMQISGIAELIEPYSEEYNRCAEYKNIPLETLKSFQETLYLIKVTPVEADFLNSEFKKKGFSVRQKFLW